MKIVKKLIFPILALLCSCEDAANDYRYPSVVTDYACLITDVNGQPEQLRLDNGNIYSIVLAEEFRDAHDPVPSYEADTLYRIISVHELGTDGVAYIYSMEQIVSVVPTPLHDGENLLQDPVYLQSCWLSGGYLNMVLELKALNGKHSIGFVDTTPEGMEGKEFSFYHAANDDVESYRQKLYASIPLVPFVNDLQLGDTLRFVVNTYDKGPIQKEFVMK